MATIKRNVSFSPDCKTRNGQLMTANAPIRMRVTFNSQRIDFSTGYKIDQEKWDKESQRVRKNCCNKLLQSATEINSYLMKLETAIQDVFKMFEYQEVMPTREQVKLAFNEKIKRKETGNTAKNVDSQHFWNVYDEFVDNCGKANNWTHSTYEKFAAFRKHLERFDKDMTFTKFNEEGIVGFTESLRKEGLRNSTLQKQMGFLRWFLRWCQKNGYLRDNSYETFRPKIKSIPKKIIFLTRDELTKLEKAEIPDTKSYLERTRDVFLFCCFTGLRHSDVYNLRRSNIKGDRIEITTIKDTDNLVIELNDHSRAILKKYENIPFEHDKVLPVISNQKMNEYLKELCKLAKIDEPIRETYLVGNERKEVTKPKYELIGTHAGRRTFICNALSLGIPAQVVMKWTGHSDYKAMKPYIDIADDIKASAMEKFNTL